MKSKNNVGKVAFDMSIVQNTWSAFFLTIVAIVYIALRTIGGEIEINQIDLSQQSFLSFAYRPSKVYMFIIGIISVSGFLTFYVKQGITRKNYFFGSVVASLVVAFVLMMMSGLITLVEQIFLPIEEVSFMGSDAPWILSVVVLSLNLLVYNLAGWMIGAGFYRYGGGVGMLFIILAIAFVSITDILWEFELKNPLKKLLDLSNLWEFPMFVSFIGTFLVLGITLWIVRVTTRRIHIKMK